MSQHSTQSKPIPISTDHIRNRSSSFSSDSSNSPPLVTPPKNFPNTPISVSSSSPILYFLSQSPTKAPPTFPFRGLPTLQDESVEDTKPTPHARRGSIASRFQPPPPAPEPHHERGVNVLRRLSLSQRPKARFPPIILISSSHVISQPTAVDTSQPGNRSPPPYTSLLTPPSGTDMYDRKTRRSATVTEGARPRRAPSPMGERILKGHFDGFN